MDLIFGKFVTAFNGFAVGTVSPTEYRSQVSKYT
jgi:ATP-binding cassette subfamily B (MDR/TAP) protein 1